MRQTPEGCTNLPFLVTPDYCAKHNLPGGSSRVTDDPIEAAYFQDAFKVFQQASKSKPGKERDALWRKAAGMYEAALKEAPGYDGAPEAAINGALAWKQVGEFGKAIDMYNLFISAYGSDAARSRVVEVRLETLQFTRIRGRSRHNYPSTSL